MIGKFHIKNYRRWISVTAAAMVAIGLVIVFIGYAVGGFRVGALFNLDETVYTTETVDSTKNPVRSITVKVDAAEITLARSGTSDYVLEYPSSRYSCKTEGGQITIGGSLAERRRPWYQAVFFSTSFDEKIVLQVPDNFTGDVELQANFGKIKITDDFTLDSLTLRSDNGEVRTGRLTVNGDVTVQSNFGNIQMEALHAAGNIHISSDNGRISMKEMTGFASANLSSNFGKVEAFHTTGRSLTIQSDNGAVKLDQVSLEDTLSVKSNFGSIRCDGIFAPKISLKSDNGSIKGTIDGAEKDFDVSFQTDYGSGSQSSKGNGMYSIEAVSSFGSIKLEFSGK